MKKWQSLLQHDAIGVISVNLSPLIIFQGAFANSWFIYFLILNWVLFSAIRLSIYLEKRKTLVIENDSKAILNERQRIENKYYAEREDVKSSLLKLALTTQQRQLDALSEIKSNQNFVDDLGSGILLHAALKELTEQGSKQVTMIKAKKAVKASKT